MEKRGIFVGVNSIKFNQQFKTDDDCLSYISEIKWEIQQAMASSLKHPLTGVVHVDEFMIGGSEEQKRGRNKGKKKLIVLAL